MYNYVLDAYWLMPMHTKKKSIAFPYSMTHIFRSASLRAGTATGSLSTRWRIDGWGIIGAIEISKVFIKGFNPQLVEVYGSTLDPSDLSLPLPIFQAKDIGFPCTCIRAVSSPPIAIVPTLFSIRRDVFPSHRILCFNIAITVITSLFFTPSPLYLARTPIRNEQTVRLRERSPPLLLENHTPVRFPYSLHTATLDPSIMRTFLLSLWSPRVTERQRGTASRDGKSAGNKNHGVTVFSAALRNTLVPKGLFFCREWGSTPANLVREPLICRFRC